MIRFLISKFTDLRRNTPDSIDYDNWILNSNPMPGQSFFGVSCHKTEPCPPLAVIKPGFWTVF